MKQIKDLNTEFIRSWNFTRSETLELLNSLSDEQLRYKPTGSDKWQPLYSQFTCMGRTQMVYTRAIREGKLDFGFFSDPELPKKNDFQKKSELIKFLAEVDKAWKQAYLQVRQEEDFVVAWPGFKQTLMNHVCSLIAHERLHHGQLLSYFTLAGIDLPTNFKTNWAL